MGQEAEKTPKDVGDIQSESDELSRSPTRIKNRRRAWLDRHSSYFDDAELELADPLLYDWCIRRFQSPAEREAAGRAKGYSRVLEADLHRSEAKLAALTGQRFQLSEGPAHSRSSGYVISPNGDILIENSNDAPKTREDGLELWKQEMAARFIRGEDEDFDYQLVDEDETLDVIEQFEAEERWFDDEKPEWVHSNDDGSHEGETGIQDF